MTAIPPELVQASIDDDPELKRRIKALVNLAVDEAHELLVSGSPSIKQNVMRTLLPAAVRAAQANKQDEELATLREQMALLIAEIRTPISEPHPPHLSVVDSDERPASS